MSKTNRKIKKNLKAAVYNITKNIRYLETDLPNGLQVLYGKYYETWLRDTKIGLNKWS